MVVHRILKSCLLKLGIPYGNGLKFNPNKCVAMLVLINGALTKYKITTEQLITVAGGPIKQLGVYKPYTHILNKSAGESKPS